MKKLFSLFLLLFAIQAQSQIVITNGAGSGSGTGTIRNWYDITTYGAVGDNSTNNTAFVQQAVNDAHVAGTLTGKGGIVWVPSGDFKIDKVTMYTNVTIKGAGKLSSHFVSNGADTMFVVDNLTPTLAGANQNDQANTMFENIRLKGRGVGTIGLYINRAANFHLQDVQIDSFTSIGYMLHNSLIGTVEHVYARNNYIGCKMYSDGSNNTAVNLVKFTDCGFLLSPKWGLEVQGGGKNSFDNCDFSACGVLNDTLTGGIYAHGNPWPYNVTFTNCWSEEGYGICVNLSMNNVTTTYDYPGISISSMKDCLWLGQHNGFETRNVSVTGHNQRLKIEDCSLSGAASVIVATGANNIVTLDNNIYGVNELVQTERSGALIRTEKAQGYIAVSATYTALKTDDVIDCTANTFTVTLPTTYKGNVFKVVNSGAGVITVNPGGFTVAAGAAGWYQCATMNSSTYKKIN